MKSWKTTVGGIGGIMVAVGGALQLLFDNNPATNPDWVAVGTAISLGWALMNARDNKVSSQDVGIRPAEPKPPIS